MSRLVFAALVFALTSFRCVPWAIDIVTDSSVEHHALVRGALTRLHNGDHAAMRRTFPEGGLFSLSFTGFALTSVALTSFDLEERRAAAREIAWLLEQTEHERAYDPFASWGTSPRRGVIFEGHQNLLRAAYVMLGGDDARIITDYHTESARLARDFAAAPSANLES